MTRAALTFKVAKVKCKYVPCQSDAYVLRFLSYKRFRRIRFGLLERLKSHFGESLRMLEFPFPWRDDVITLFNWTFLHMFFTVKKKITARNSYINLWSSANEKRKNNFTKVLKVLETIGKCSLILKCFFFFLSFFVLVM